jgi:hypothetical protein
LAISVPTVLPGSGRIRGNAAVAAAGLRVDSVAVAAAADFHDKIQPFARWANIHNYQLRKYP